MKHVPELHAAMPPRRPARARLRLADHVQDAREALQAVCEACRKPVLLAAHSMGAMLALAGRATGALLRA